MGFSSPGPEQRLALLLCGLLALAVGPRAWAEEPPPAEGEAPHAGAPAAGAPDAEAGDGDSADGGAVDASKSAGAGSFVGGSESDMEQITVWGEAEVQRRRHVIDQDLRAHGYRAGMRKGDKTVYRPEVAWKPSVVVYEDGFVVLKRSPVQVGVPKGVSPWWNLACPLAPHLCVRIGGQIVSTRKLNAAKSRVMEQSGGEIQAWERAIAATAMEVRINQDVPELLDGIWLRGQTPEGEGLLQTPAQRRAALTQFWASRSCTPEGDRVRQATETYISEIVQSSDAPLTLAEQAQANSACPCERRLDVVSPAPPRSVPSP